MKETQIITPIRQGKVNRLIPAVLLAALLGLTAGCGAGRLGKKQEFFTSGSRDADQRASQEMAKHEQLAQAGDENGDAPGHAEGKRTLFDRLGGTAGIEALVADFTRRVIADPRVNWQRQGITQGGLFRASRSVAWDPSPANVATLKQHLVQFLSLATGGPSDYDGENIKSSHAKMSITNAEFNATVGDLKVTLDRLKVADREQKELLAIVESTRSQIVTER